MHSKTSYWLVATIFGLQLATAGCGKKSQNESTRNPWDIPGNQDAPANPVPGGDSGSSSDISACNADDQFICAIESAIANGTNQARASSGLSSLKHNFKVSFAARDWSRSQALSGVLGHNGFPEQRYSVLRSEFGSFDAFLRAENVATGYPQSSDAEEIGAYFVNLWMNSPGHRNNILGSHGSIGVGVYEQNSQYYATQIFY